MIDMSVEDTRATLVARLRARLAVEGIERSPVGIHDIELAEMELGYALPSFLRMLYATVTDGGFGPGLDVAIPRYPAGQLWPLRRVVETYAANLKPMTGFEPWPERLLPIATLGGDADVAVACQGGAPVVLMWDADLAHDRPGDAWVVLANSLEEWFGDWLSADAPKDSNRLRSWSSSM